MQKNGIKTTRKRTFRDSDSATMYIVEASDEADRRSAMRLLLLALGWICVALGVIGMLVPGFPGMVFLLGAVWAFSRSSPRLHRWLHDHPRWGGAIRAWRIHRAITPLVKGLAVAGMALGIVSAALFLDAGWGVPVAMAVVLIPVAAFIMTRPGGPRFPDPSPG